MTHLFVRSINFFHGYKNLKSFVKKIFYRLILISGFKPGFIGPFKTWELATASSVGYDYPVVLNMVRNAITNVLDGINLYERDGATFNEYPSKNTLRAILRDYLSADSVVVDFGGGLGGTYVNNRDLFSSVYQKYFIIEQPTFAEAGNALANQFNLPLSFYSDISFIPQNPHILILSGVLQYIPNWEILLASMLDKEPLYIIVDRQILTNSTTRIYVQANNGYYESSVSYPCRIINRDFFLAAFSNYELLEEWISDFDPSGYFGFLLKKTPL